MPTSVIAAVAASTVSQYVMGVAVLEYGMGALAAGVLSAAAGGLTSVAVGAAFSDSPDQIQGQSQSQQQLTQELRDNLVTVRQPISHWQYIYGRTRVGGALTFAHQTPATVDNPEAQYLAENPDVAAAGLDPWQHYVDFGKDEGRSWPTPARYFHLVITLAGHVSQEIEAIQFGDEVVPLDGNGNATGRYAGFVRIKKSLGDEAGQPFPDLVAESEGKWTDAHRQSGRTKIYVRLTASADLFPTGLPNITAVIKGWKVYDPRTGLTAWSDTASLCVSHYLCDAAAGLGSVYADEIDNTQLIAAANIDDEAVNLSAGGTEKRYTLNGAFLVNAEPRAVLGRLLTANAGKARYIGGVWRIEPAAYVVPTITLTEDDLRAVPHVSPRLSGGDLSNRVKGLYVSEANLWQPTDFPPVTNATYLAEDEGEPSWHELDLPYTKSAATAQRIAKIELEKIRQQISVDWPGKFSCYRLQPGDTVKITFAMLGWVEKVFEVAKASLVFEGDDDGMRLGCDLSLRETASAVFDWGTGEETTVDLAPDTNLPDPWGVWGPGVPTLSSGTTEIIEGGDGALISRIKVSLPALTDVRAVQVEMRYKRSSDSVWFPGPIVPVDAGASWISPVEDSVAYDIALRYINSFGVSSGWTQAAPHTVIGETSIPATVATVATTQTHCFFSKVADRDVKGYQIRAVPGTAAMWSLGVPIHDGLVTDSPYPYQKRLIGVNTIMVAAVDRGDRVGVPAHASLDFGVIDEFNIAESYDYHAAGFPGTITSATVSAGNLVADADPSIDIYSRGGEDFYTHDNVADIYGGSMYLAMQYADVFVPHYSGGELIIDSTLAGSRTAIEWRVDGGTLGDIYSGTDIYAGTDLYGPMPAWQPYIGVIDSTADWGVQFRVSIDAGPAWGQITALSARLQMPAKDQIFYSVAIDAGGTRLAPASGVPALDWIRVEEAVFTVYNDGSGAISGRVTDFDPALGPLVQLLNAAGAAVSATGQSVRVSGY